MKKLSTKTLRATTLTPARERRLAELAARPDETIDRSDLPELDAAFWKNAIRNPHYRPVKQQITLRLDSDVMVWLRKQGRGYQTRINRMLRDAMAADLRRSA